MPIRLMVHHTVIDTPGFADMILELQDHLGDEIVVISSSSGIGAPAELEDTLNFVLPDHELADLDEYGVLEEVEEVEEFQEVLRILRSGLLLSKLIFSPEAQFW